jgi:predicted exporter
MKKLLRPAVILWLVFLLGCGLLISRSQFTADMSAFLPRHPSVRQQILIDQISEGFASRALLVGLEDANPDVLAKLSETIAKQLRELPDFLTVSNGQSNTADKDRELLFKQRYILSPAINAERMSVVGLRAAISDSLAEVGSSTGLFSKALLSRDPSGELLEVLKRVVPSSQPAQAEGVWMNAAQTRALLLLQTRAQGSDLDAQETAHAAIRDAFAKAQAKVGEPAAGARLKFSGPSVFAVSSRDTIKSEASRLSTIGTLLVLGFLWLIYRSVSTLFLGIIPVITGAAAGIAAVGLGFPAVHGMTLGFGVTLIGEAVDYAIYLFVQHEPVSEQDTHAADDRSQTFSLSFWPTIRLGVLTSVFGFSTLLFSGFTGLAQLGLFSIVGVLIAALVTRYVLPELLPAHFHVRQSPNLGALLARMAHKMPKLKGLALALTLTALLFLGLKFNTLWSVELGGLSPVPDAAQKLDGELRADMGAADTGALIVLKATSSEAALQLSETVSQRLSLLVNSGALSGFEAPSVYLPSLRMQEQRRASLPDAQTLQANLSQALVGLPLKPDKLSGFIADVTEAKNAKPLTRAELEGTSLSLGVDALLMQSPKAEQQWTALIALKAPVLNGEQQALPLPQIESAITEISPDARGSIHVLALKQEASMLYQAYLKEAIILTLIGFVAIIVLLLISLRSFVRVWQLITPLLAAVVAVAATVVLIKGSLSLLHLIGLLLVVAVGSNYALFFDQRARTASALLLKTADHRMLCSLLYANLCTVMGFGLLAFSSVPVMNALGLTVSLGTFLALVFSAIFTKSAVDHAPLSP